MLPLGAVPGVRMCRMDTKPTPEPSSAAGVQLSNGSSKASASISGTYSEGTEPAPTANTGMSGGVDMGEQ